MEEDDLFRIYMPFHSARGGSLAFHFISLPLIRLPRRLIGGIFALGTAAPGLVFGYKVFLVSF